MRTISEPSFWPQPTREPAKRETRLGWWFMRTFRRREVARRTARNEIMAASWILLQRYDSWAALQSSEAGELFADSRDRLCRAFDTYNAVDSDIAHAAGVSGD